MKLILSIILLFGGSLNLWAQWNWGPDEPKAKEMNAKYTDFMKQGNFDDALEPLEWLLENTPDLNPSIYINGAKIYKALVNVEKDENKKKALQLKTLATYDTRIKYFKGEANILNRKAYVAYKYLKNDKDQYQQLIDLFEEVYRLNGKKVAISNHVAYIDLVKRYKSNGGTISDEKILNIYDNISSIISDQKQTGKNVEALDKNQNLIDKILATLVPLDCAFIEDKLGASFKKDINNIALAKKIIKLSLTYKCTDKPTFLDAAKRLQEAEPTFGIAKLIAMKSDRIKEHTEAEKYYQQAISLTEENIKKAEVFYGLSNHYRIRGLKSKSKDYALKTVSADPGKKEAYKIIGDLYMASFNDCKKEISKVEDRAVYIAAYKMYQKAGNNSGMLAAKAQFPSMEEIFELGLKEGQAITVGCWINEIVKIQKRPSGTN